MLKVVDRFMLASEAARKLGLTPQRVRQLVDQGDLPAERGPGNIRLIDRASVEKLSERRSRSAKQFD